MKSATNLMLTWIVIAVLALTTAGQSTEFTYQGTLSTGGVPASGNFDFELALFDALNGGTQVGATLSRNTISVVNGGFTFGLDFGNQFPGTDRYLEIRVRQAGGGAFTTLAPRQKLASAPYAVKSLSSENSFQLAGVAANQYVLTTDPRLSDARQPTAGSDNYIQNTSSPQAASNFNISGNGTVGGTLSASVVNAASQVGAPIFYDSNNLTYYLDPSGTSRINGLRWNNVDCLNSFCPSNGVIRFTPNFYLNSNAGSAVIVNLDNGPSPPNTPQLRVGNGVGTDVFDITSGGNVGIGTSAPSEKLHVVGNGLFTGNLTVNGSFTGSVSAASVTGILGTANGGTGVGTSGASGNFLRSNGSAWASSPLAASDIPSGSSNYVQNQNAAPQASTNFNISGNGQAAIFDAGTQFNLGGNRIIRVALTSNLGVGHGAGQGLTIGTENSFFGKNAGFTNGSGSYNSFFGWSAGYDNLGSGNTFVGRSSGTNNTTGSDNTFVGINTGFNNTTGQENTFFGSGAGDTNTTGSSNTIIGRDADVGANNLSFATAIGADAVVSQNNTIVLGRSPGVDSVGIGISTPARLLHVNGRARIGSIPPEPSTADVCFNAAGDLVQCGASSLKWKTNVRPFDLGLDAVLRLRPINFTWKETGVLDFGLGAEDVAHIAPELTIKDNQGEVTGVKYDRIAVVLINAVKEQQSQLEEQQGLIKAQKKQIERQQAELDSLRALICAGRVKSAVCRAGK